MADAAFREDQWSRRYDTHVAPLNQLVDDLANLGHGWLPYIAPMYGGVNARLLSLLRDPGPRTQTTDGSGFLSMENDDPTAEAICGYFADVGISANDIVPWNGYPWYINRNPSIAELNLGLEPLHRMIQLLPRLQVVMLHGRSAHASWRRLLTRYANLAHTNLHVIETYHTSRQAFRHKDPAVRAQRREHLRNAFRQAADLLSEVHPPAV